MKLVTILTVAMLVAAGVFLFLAQHDFRHHAYAIEFIPAAKEKDTADRFYVCFRTDADLLKYPDETGLTCMERGMFEALNRGESPDGFSL